MILDTIAPMLRHAGHRVDVASSGQEGLDRLSGGLEVDLVILDQNMPGLSGVETLRQIRAAHSGLPVVLSTGLVDSTVEATLSAHAGVWLLRKPFAIGELRTAIHSACP